MGTIINAPSAPEINLTDFPTKRAPDGYLEPVTGDNSVAKQFQFIKEFANQFIYGYPEGQAWNYEEPGKNSIFWFMEQLRGLVSAPGFPASLEKLDVDYSYIVQQVQGILDRLQTYRPTPLDNDDLNVASVEPPVDPDIREVADPEDITIPPFGGEPPAVTLPPPPSDEMPVEPGDPPAIVYPEDVTPPSYTEPVKPVIADITIPPPPETVAVPTFDAVAPTLPTLTPAACFSWDTEHQYDSELALSIRTKLKDWVDNGGTGLGEAVETAIWERAQERLTQEQQKAYDNIMYLNRGFEYPGPMKQYALGELANRAAQQDTDLSNEIAIKQAELAQANTQFAVQQAIGWEGVVIAHVDNIAGRAFDAAKYAAEHALQVYGAWVNIFNARVNKYNAQIAAFTAQFQAVTIEIERWKAELQGKEIQSRIQQQKIEVFVSEWEAIKHLFGVYAEQIKANEVKIEAERAKLQAYSELVNGYSKRVDAKIATYNLWTQKIQGEGLKVDVYGKEIQAYGTHVQALRSVAEIERIKADIGNQRNATEAAVYSARVQGYLARLNAAVEQVKAHIAHFGEQARLYSTDTAAVTAQQNAEIEQAKMEMQNQMNDANVDIEEYKANMGQVWEWMKNLVAALGEEMKVAAQVGASALSAINASASIRSGFDMNWGESQSWGAAVDNAARVSASETHSFDHGEID